MIYIRWNCKGVPESIWTNDQIFNTAEPLCPIDLCVVSHRSLINVAWHHWPLRFTFYILLVRWSHACWLIMSSVFVADSQILHIKIIVWQLYAEIPYIPSCCVFQKSCSGASTPVVKQKCEKWQIIVNIFQSRYHEIAKLFSSRFLNVNILTRLKPNVIMQHHRSSFSSEDSIKRGPCF